MKFLKWLLLAVVLIQVIPYGHTHANPLASGEPPWNSPQTRELFRRACFDCHSNETVWPWYSNVAPYRGEMPPWFYLPMHPAARLSDAEKQALEDGAEKSLGAQAGPEKR